MCKMKNSAYRAVARSILKDQGFDVEVKSGQGYLYGSRLIIRKAGEKFDVAVKASQERVVNFTKASADTWRTLNAVDLVIAVVPAAEGETGADFFVLPKKPVQRVFNRAWKALEAAKRPLGFNIPIFVPLDQNSRKNVGHDIGNLKKTAEWPPVHLGEEELLAKSVDAKENYINDFCCRYAAENGVDVSQVLISIVGKAK